MLLCCSFFLVKVNADDDDGDADGDDDNDDDDSDDDDDGDDDDSDSAGAKIMLTFGSVRWNRKMSPCAPLGIWLL